MIEPKQHIKDIYRINPDSFSRSSFLRLDKNESLGGIPSDFLNEMMERITPEKIAKYPEYATAKKKIADHVNVKPENILITNGSDSAIKYIFETYISPQDSVLLTDPTFAMYPIYCRIFNVIQTKIVYQNCNSFPKKEFFNSLSSNHKLIVIVNPNNPTGVTVDLTYIHKLLVKAQENHSLVIVDEAYYYYKSKSAADLVKKFDNLIVLRTFSKLFGLASLRVGYAIAQKDIIENLRTVQPTFDVNGVGILFCESIVTKPNIIDALIQDEQEGKSFLCKNLSKNNIHFISGDANFILIKCDDKQEQIVNDLFDRKILVGSGFKHHYLKDYIRVTTGKKKYMKQFWNEFIDIWESL